MPNPTDYGGISKTPTTSSPVPQTQRNPVKPIPIPKDSPLYTQPTLHSAVGNVKPAPNSQLIGYQDKSGNTVIISKGSGSQQLAQERASNVGQTITPAPGGSSTVTTTYQNILTGQKQTSNLSLSRGVTDLITMRSQAINPYASQQLGYASNYEANLYGFSRPPSPPNTYKYPMIGADTYAIPTRQEYEQKYAPKSALFGELVQGGKEQLSNMNWGRAGSNAAIGAGVGFLGLAGGALLPPVGVSVLGAGLATAGTVYIAKKGFDIFSAPTFREKGRIATQATTEEIIPGYLGYRAGSSGLINLERIKPQFQETGFNPKTASFFKVAGEKQYIYQGYTLNLGRKSVNLFGATDQSYTYGGVPKLALEGQPVNYQPTSIFETKLYQKNIGQFIAQPAGNLVEGRIISPGLQQEYFSKALTATEKLGSVKNIFKSEETFFSPTTRGGSQAVRNTYQIGAQEKGLNYGSAAVRAQLSPVVSREVGDFDFHFKTGNEELLAGKTTAVMQGWKSAGEIVRQPAGEKFSFESFKGGEWGKAFEAKGQGIGEGEIVPAKAYGFDLTAERYTTTIGGYKVASIRGETYRKLAASTILGEEGSLAVKHEGRYKDVPDLFRNVYTLTESARAQGNLKAVKAGEDFLGLAPKMGVKYINTPDPYASLKTPSKSIGYSVSPKSITPAAISYSFRGSPSSPSTKSYPILSPSPSPSPSPSFSISPSPSVSPSYSISPSPSPSPYKLPSPSVSPSPSISPSPYISPSFSISPSISSSPSPSPSPSFLPSVIIPPFAFPEGGGTATTNKPLFGRPRRFKRKYTPTVQAIIFNIRGKKNILGTKTGFGLRPIAR